MSKPKINCSHKTIEWKEYLENKKDGDGIFPPIKYCFECEESRKLKLSVNEK